MSHNDSTTLKAVSLIGDCTAVTQTQSDNSTKLATTAYVDTAVSGAGGSKPDVNAVSSGTNYTITTYTGIEELFLVTPSANIEIALPSAATVGAGYKYTIKNLGAFSLTINPNGSEYIDFAAQTTYVLPAQYDAATVSSDGSNWYLV